MALLWVNYSEWFLWIWSSIPSNSEHLVQEYLNRFVSSNSSRFIGIIACFQVWVQFIFLMLAWNALLSTCLCVGQVLSRFDLSPQYIHERLNSAIFFLASSNLIHAAILWTLLFVTYGFASPAGWAVRLILLTLLDLGYALSALQISKKRFAHQIEAQIKGTSGWTKFMTWIRAVLTPHISEPSERN